MSTIVALDTIYTDSVTKNSKLLHYGYIAIDLRIVAIVHGITLYRP